MKVGHMFDTIDESNARIPTKEENILLLERKKRSLLHELKIISTEINKWINSGVITQMGEGDKHPDAGKIPDSETRRILTTDPVLQEKVLRTFARFANAREMLSNSVMPELEELMKSTEVKTEEKGEEKNESKKS